MKKLLLTLVLITFIPLCCFPQAEIKVSQPGVSVNDNGNNTPDPSAILHVNSTTKGVIFSPMTTDERNAIPNPAPGLMVFNTDACVYQYYNGTGWSDLGVAPVQEIPEAPSDFQSELTGAEEINLSWNDNATVEQGFILERATNSSFTEDLTAINLPADQISYVDNVSGGHNVIYYYRVRAINGCQKSGFSNTTSQLLLSISNTYAHYTTRGDQANNLVINTGSNIQAWRDQSGNGSDLSQTIPTAQPHVYDTGEPSIGEKKAVHFDFGDGLKAGNKQQFSFLHQGNQDYTMLMVVKPFFDGLGINSSLVNSQSQGSNTGFAIVIGPKVFGRTNEGTFQVNIKNGSGRPLDLFADLNNAEHGGVNIVCFRFRASDGHSALTYTNAFHNKKEATGTAFGPFASGDSSLEFHLGQISSPKIDGSYGEFVVWQNYLPDSELHDIMDLLYEYYSGTP